MVIHTDCKTVLSFLISGLEELMHLLVVFSSNCFELSCFDEFSCEKLPADHFWLNRGYLLAECSNILFLFIKELYRE